MQSQCDIITVLLTKDFGKLLMILQIDMLESAFLYVPKEIKMYF